MTVKARRGRLRRSISSAKQRRGQKESSIIQSDVPRNFVDKNMHYDKMEAEKYLRKSCYYRRALCSATKFMAVFMWRKLLNSIALVTLTHKGPVRVSDETSTQVVAWTTDKWRTRIIQREVYNVRDP